MSFCAFHGVISLICLCSQTVVKYIDIKTSEDMDFLSIFFNLLHSFVRIISSNFSVTNVPVAYVVVYSQ